MIYYGIVVKKYFLDNEGNVHAISDMTDISTAGLYSTEVYEVSLVNKPGSTVVAHNASSSSFTIGDRVIVVEAQVDEFKKILFIVGGIPAEHSESVSSNTYFSRGNKPRRGYTFSDGKSTVSIGSLGIELRSGGQSDSQVVIGQISNSSGIQLKTRGGGIMLNSTGDTLVSSKTFSVSSSDTSISAINEVQIKAPSISLSGNFETKGDSVYLSSLHLREVYAASSERGYLKFIQVSHSTKDSKGEYSGYLLRTFKNDTNPEDFYSGNDDFNEKNVAFDMKTYVSENEIKLKIATYKNSTENKVYPVVVDNGFLNDLIKVLNKVHEALDSLKTDLTQPTSVSGACPSGSVIGTVILTSSIGKIIAVQSEIQSMQNKLKNYISDVLSTSSQEGTS